MTGRPWTRTTPLAHLTCRVGLDDSTRENGCVHYTPGSHRRAGLPAPGLAGVPAIPKDEPMRGRFFPLLFEGLARGE